LIDEHPEVIELDSDDAPYLSATRELVDTLDEPARL
jgi:hypothetical protein